MIDGYMRVFYNDKNIILVIYAIIFISLYLILGYWGDKIILTDKYYKNINLQYYDLYNFKEKYNDAFWNENMFYMVDQGNIENYRNISAMNNNNKKSIILIGS